jgi:predicted site-specific integrase-resolvase
MGRVSLMPVKIDGEEHYWTLEVCRKAHISRCTLMRWIENGVLTKIRRDRRGWRLFTENDLRVIIAESERTTVEETTRPKKGGQ